jgi:hypothetical protein
VPRRSDEVREAFASVTRALKRVALYRHARDQHAAYLAPALSALNGLLSTVPHVTLAVEPGALLFEGDVVHSEAAREGSFCFRLHRDGVRSLTFCRGIDLAELLLLVDVALPPGSAARREDAVTQLWKAELKCIRWAAVSGYRLDADGDTGGDSPIEETARRAQQVLDDLPAAAEREPLAPLMTPEERAIFDSGDWGEVSRSIADILARIVERGFASRDLPALAECFARLCGEMVDRREHAALLWSLRRAANLTGNAAISFRQAAGELLGERALLVRGLDLSARAGSVAGDLIPVWLEMLPDAAGPLAVGLIAEDVGAAEATALANAALDRLRHCRPEIEAALSAGPTHLARILLAAVRKLQPALRASLGARALAHPSVQVRLAAVPLVGMDGPQAVEHLGPLLRHPDATLRMAAADALSRSEDCAEQAADLLVGVAAGANVSRFQREEQTALYRAIGHLATSRGLEFLADRLAGAKRRLLGRNRAEPEQLLAVRGLVEDGSERALGLLEQRAALADPVGAACRAAAAMARAKRSAA